MNSEELDTALGLGFAIAETSLLLLLLDEVDIDIVEERDRASPGLTVLRRSYCWFGWTSVEGKKKNKKSKEHQLSEPQR